MRKRTRCLMVELRRAADGAPAGVVLLAPSRRYAGVVTDTVEPAVERRLSVVAWREIEAWIDAGDAGLPTRPSALPTWIVASLVGDQGEAVIGRRSSSFEMDAEPGASHRSTLARSLPALFEARRSQR